MKISKRPVKSAETEEHDEVIVSPDNNIDDSEILEEGIEEFDMFDSSKYADGIDNIRRAINSLVDVAADDEIAQQAIINLSVILFDLQQ